MSKNLLKQMRTVAKRGGIPITELNLDGKNFPEVGGYRSANPSYIKRDR